MLWRVMMLWHDQDQKEKKRREERGYKDIHDGDDGTKKKEGKCWFSLPHSSVGTCLESSNNHQTNKSEKEKEDMRRD